MSKEIDLKPCPHCGGTEMRIFDRLYDGHKERVYYVVCLDCRMKGPETSSSNSAAQAWNDLPRALVWSSEPPSESGFWWWELCGNRGVDLIQDPEKRVIRDYRAKWAGPIPEPKTILYPQLNEEKGVITFSAPKQDEKKESL